MDAVALFAAPLVAAVTSAGLAAFLVARARAAPGAGALIGFLLLVALWSLGLILPAPWNAPPLAAAPLGGALFFDFAGRFTGGAQRSPRGAYLLAGLAVAIALCDGPGVITPRGFRYQGGGLVAVAATLVLAALGQGRLLRAWRRAQGLTRRHYAVAGGAAALGLCAALGLAIPLFDWDLTPAPLLLLPAYPLLLTYGVARYELLADQARAQAAEEARRLAELGALAATVAHDLRNPMNIIAMAAADAPAEVRREISAQLARMDALTRDLLDYAKPWAVRPEPLDLAAALRQAIASLGPEAARVRLDAPDLILTADPLRLHQALVNLLTNAAADPAATISVSAARAPDGAIRIDVADDGPGVPAEIRAALFQPFVSRSAQGTGLGLAIVAKAMRAHGGAAALIDVPRGACFRLSFPA